jgi:hypothetical protein
MTPDASDGTADRRACPRCRGRGLLASTRSTQSVSAPRVGRRIPQYRKGFAVEFPPRHEPRNRPLTFRETQRSTIGVQVTPVT